MTVEPQRQACRVFDPAAATVSPELALVDPALRAIATAALPPLEPLSFLRQTQKPEAIRDFAALAVSYDDYRTTPPLLVQALCYGAYHLLQMLVTGIIVAAGLAIVVLIVAAIG